MLAAMALPGVAALRRWTRLGRLESFTYGSVLGVVVGSIALVPAAIVFGLNAIVIAAVAVLAAGLGLLIRRGATRRPPERPDPRMAIGLGAALVLAAFGLRWILLGSTLLTLDSHGLEAGHVHVWGDWAHHLSDATCFAFADNFPPLHPRFAGRPHAYHWLSSLTVAAMIRLGLSPVRAMPLHSVVFLTLTTLAVFGFARRLTRDASMAALALVLFMVGGGLGWLLTLRHALAAAQPAEAFWSGPWDATAQWDGNFRWLDTIFAYLVPQRPVLYGLPLAMLALSLLWDGVREGRWSDFAIAGLAAGVMPFANLGAMLALALLTPFLFLTFPRRGWLLFFALWAALALPVFLLERGGGALSFIRPQVGWIAAPDPWWFFWLKNLGAFAPLLLWALFDPEVLPRPGRRFLWPFMAIFVIANLMLFQPWDWDNTKILIYWYLASSILVAATLVRLWRSSGFATRALLGVVVLSLVSSGALSNLNQMLGRDRHLLLTTNEVQVAEAVRRATPPHALILTGLQHNHPVPVLAGRRVVMGYPGDLWSTGIDGTSRERDVRAIYALAPGWERTLAGYGIDDVVIGPWERENFHPDEAGFAARFPRIVDRPPYAVFQVRGVRADSSANARSAATGAR